MRVRTRVLPLLMGLPLLAVLIAGCSIPSARAGTSVASASTVSAQSALAERPAERGYAAVDLPRLVRSNAEGSVEVVVTPQRSTSDRIAFTVQLNTHMGDLSYDMTKIATLRDDEGRSYEVEGWQGNMGGHHVQGELTFRTHAGAAPKWLELSLSGIDDIPMRSFRWDTR